MAFLFSFPFFFPLFSFLQRVFWRLQGPVPCDGCEMLLMLGGVLGAGKYRCLAWPWTARLASAPHRTFSVYDNDAILGCSLYTFYLCTVSGIYLMLSACACLCSWQCIGLSWGLATVARWLVALLILGYASKVGQNVICTNVLKVYPGSCTILFLSPVVHSPLE